MAKYLQFMPTANYCIWKANLGILSTSMMRVESKLEVAWTCGGASQQVINLYGLTPTTPSLGIGQVLEVQFHHKQLEDGAVFTST